MTRPKRQGHPLLAAVLTAGLATAGVAQAQEAERPAEELPPAVSEELRFLKEETVSIASRYEQPISEAPPNVYVITDEDIRQSGATDLPTILRRIPGIEVIQMSGADFNVSARRQPDRRQQDVGHGGWAIDFHRHASSSVLEGDPRHLAGNQTD